MKAAVQWLFVLAATWGGAAAAPAEPADRGFPQAQSDLLPDPRVTFGQLDNGLRYAILPHPVPAGALSVHLHVQVGSYHEEEHERGYAHFVEHMVFNGTRDFPGQQVTRELQLLGARLGGPDANAVTSRFHTNYFINNLPTDRPEEWQRALLILRNFADGALFDSREVDQERRVVLAEGRAGGMSRIEGFWAESLLASPAVPHRLRVHELEGLWDETRLEHRRPQGSRRVISRATANLLTRFYERWYRPERMVLVVAGDLDPPEVETAIIRTFASMKRADGSDELAIVPPRAPVPPLPRLFGRQQRDQASTVLTLATVVRRDSPDTEATRRRALARRLALDLLTDRIVRETVRPVAIAAWLSTEVPTWEVALIRNEGQPEDSARTAVLIDTELRRALTYGFGPVEVEAAVRSARLKVVEREAAAAHWPAARLAEALAQATTQGFVFTAAEDDRRRQEAILDSITAEECHAALRELWPHDQTHVLLLGPDAVTRTAHEELRRQIEVSRAIPVARPHPPPEPRPFPYTDFGPAGELVEQRHHAELDFWLMRFSNGVQLNFKHTSEERGWVRVKMRFGDGRMAASSVSPVEPWTGLALMRAPVRGRDMSEMRSPLLQLAFRRELSLSTDHFGWTAELPASDLRRGLELAAATLEHSNLEAVEGAVFRSWLRNTLLPGQQTARGVAERVFRESMHGRADLADPTAEAAGAIPLDDGLPWLRSHLQYCPVSLTIVGDVSRDDVVAAVAATLGALPPRREALSRSDFRRQMPTPPSGVRRVEFAGNKSLATAIIGWSLPDEAGGSDDVRLSLLSRILDERLDDHIRENLGLSYSPTVSLQSWREFEPRRLTLWLKVESAPRDLETVAAAARRILADFGRDAITDTELEHARRPLIRQMAILYRSNLWWLEVLPLAQLDPALLEDLARQQEIAADCTAEELTVLAQRLLDPDQALQILASPR